MRPPATQRRWFHPDPELARREKRRKEIQELFLKDQDAAREEEEKLMKEKDEMEKAHEGPAPPPASLMEWKELPSGIGALKTVELIGTFSRSIFPLRVLPSCYQRTQKNLCSLPPSLVSVSRFKS